MADITGNQADSRTLQPSSPAAEGSLSERLRSPRLRPSQTRLIGAGTLVVLLIVCLAVWGSGMEFPTTVSTSRSPYFRRRLSHHHQDGARRLRDCHRRRRALAAKGRGLAFRRAEFRGGLCAAQN